MNDVRVFDFDGEWVAAKSFAEAVKFYEESSGDNLGLNPENEEEDVAHFEMSLDHLMIIIDDIGHEGECECPFCGKKWTETTIREWIKGIEKFPCYIGSTNG